VWKQSRADQLHAISYINQFLATTFPNETFYSAVGNHDAGTTPMRSKDQKSQGVPWSPPRFLLVSSFLYSSMQSLSDAKYQIK